MQQIVKFSKTQIAQMNLSSMKGFVKNKQDDINFELRKLGAVSYDLWLPETRTLPYIIHPDEEIIGIVYGHYGHDNGDQARGRGALVATNRRILLIDKKPLFLKCDELAYKVISGVTLTQVAAIGTIMLHTREGNIHVRTLNKRSATAFSQAIESKLFSEALD